jgi:hypothetical protein
MKKIFAALASVLLVSTAFAQTGAPASSGDQPTHAATQATGQANLKAGNAMSGDAMKADASGKQAATSTDKSEAKVPGKKAAGVHTQKAKAKKVSKTKHITAASADKTKATGDSKEASTAPVKADGARTDTTKTN